MELEQLAPGTDVIFVGACNAASQPAAQDAVHEAERCGIAEGIAGCEQSAQRDRLAKAPDPIVPAHRDSGDSAQIARVSCELQQNFEQATRAGMIAERLRAQPHSRRRDHQAVRCERSTGC